MHHPPPGNVVAHRGALLVAQSVKLYYNNLSSYVVPKPAVKYEGPDTMATCTSNREWCGFYPASSARDLSRRICGLYTNRLPRLEHYLAQTARITLFGCCCIYSAEPTVCIFYLFRRWMAYVRKSKPTTFCASIPSRTTASSTPSRANA